MIEIIGALKDANIPTILAIAGIILILLAMGVEGGIKLPADRQKPAGVTGVVLLLIGIGLFSVQKNDQNTSPPTPTVAVSPPTSAPTVAVSPPTATDTPIPILPTPTLRPLRDIPISIRPIGNDNIQSLFPGFNRFGEQVFGGVKFLISEKNGKASTECAKYSNWPSKLSAPIHNIDSPEEIYILMNAGYTTAGHANDKIGQIIVNFNNGRTYSYSLVLGQNIREWRPDVLGTFESASSSDLQKQVYSSDETISGDSGLIDMLKLSIPKELQGFTLSSIVFQDTQPGDPCFMIMGITVKARS